MERIEAEQLIPGRGEPIQHGCVVMERGKILYAGPTVQAPPTPNATVTEAKVVMPGLWDCHAHLIGLLRPDLAALVIEPIATAAARAVKDLERALMGGVTTIREVGGLGIYLARVIADGSIPGPHVYAAGGVLSITGGHGDVHAFPLDVLHRLEGISSILALCDGVPACLQQVRRQLRLGARLIKICASGGVMSELDHPIHQQFSDEEMRAIVDEAARADRIVAAHCHGKPGIMAALRSGVATIEHGSYLDEEAADLMTKNGTMLVPTRFIVEHLLQMKSSMPEFAYRKLAAIAERHIEAIRIAIHHGVKIAAGTDIFVSGAAMWGKNGLEASYLVKAGMTPLQAIEAFTANGPATLGPQAPKSGLLAPGYDADAITLDADPVADISVLGNAQRVTGVWRAGTQQKIHLRSKHEVDGSRTRRRMERPQKSTEITKFIPISCVFLCLFVAISFR
jgi:imidazolonepropionase-like amidohydrolase